MDAYLAGRTVRLPAMAPTSREFSMDAWSKKPFQEKARRLSYGRSISIFDATDKKWKQTWVDSQGSYLDFVGGLKMAR